MKNCSIDGCGKRVLALGLCSAHYQRQRAYGTPLGSENTKRDEAATFLEQTVLAREHGDCVIWPFATVNGHPVVGRRRLYVRRVVCEAFHGPAPSDKHIAEPVCGNVRCVSNAHLGWRLKGKKAGASRGAISDAERREVVSLSREMQQVDIARRFGITASGVSKIISRHRAKTGGGY